MRAGLTKATNDRNSQADAVSTGLKIEPLPSTASWRAPRPRDALTRTSARACPLRKYREPRPGRIWYYTLFGALYLRTDERCIEGGELGYQEVDVLVAAGGPFTWPPNSGLVLRPGHRALSWPDAASTTASPLSACCRFLAFSSPAKGGGAGLPHVPRGR